jgi:hypothetical protein
MRREIPLLLVFLAGVVMAVQFFVPSEFSGNVKDFMTDWLIIIGIFAMALGIYSLVRVSWARISRRAENWQYSVITLLGLFAMIVFGIQIPGVKYAPEIEARDAVSALGNLNDSINVHVSPLMDTGGTAQPSAADVMADVSRLADSCLVTAEYILGEEWILKSADQTTALKQLETNLNNIKRQAAASLAVAGDSLQFPPAVAQVQESSKAAAGIIAGFGDFENRRPFIGGQASYMFRQFFNHIMIPIQATMFSLLAFFIASAAYRAFRARSVLATVLLAAALVLMLRLIPLGPLTGFFNDLSSWILLTPNLAAKRAILIGVGLGMVATALKVVLGIERNYLGRD